MSARRTHHTMRQHAARIAFSLAYRVGHHILAEITAPGPRDEDPR